MGGTGQGFDFPGSDFAESQFGFAAASEVRYLCYTPCDDGNPMFVLRERFSWQDFSHFCTKMDDIHLEQVSFHTIFLQGRSRFPSTASAGVVERRQVKIS